MVFATNVRTAMTLIFASSVLSLQTPFIRSTSLSGFEGQNEFGNLSLVRGGVHSHLGGVWVLVGLVMGYCRQ